MSFVPIFHSESTRIDNLSITRWTQPEEEDESSKQRDEDHHASNLSLIILDEHKNPCSNLYLVTRHRRFPGGMIHGGAHNSF
jgi:hypothetical protein